LVSPIVTANAQVITNLGDTIDGPSPQHSRCSRILRIHEAAELNDAIARLDFNVAGFHCVLSRQG